MDVMRLLRSLEEFLYELVGWLVFFPRTCWRVLVHPAGIARYTQQELAKPAEKQFEETISPVLMLILSVCLAHAVELVLRGKLELSNGPVEKMLFGTEEALLLTRCIVFCTFAFVASISLLQQQRLPVTRDTLREPFSIQAFLVAPFVLFCSAASLLSRIQLPIAILVFAVGLAWYVWARAAAYRELVRVGWRRALLYVTAMTLATSAAIFAVLAVVVPS